MAVVRPASRPQIMSAWRPGCRVASAELSSRKLTAPARACAPLPLSAQPEGDGHRIDERHLTEEGTSGQGEHRQIQHVRLAEPIEQGRQRQNGNGQQQGITEPLQGLGQDLSGVLNWHKGAEFCDVAHILPTRTHLGIGASPFIGPFLISDQTIGEPTDPEAGSAG